MKYNKQALDIPAQLAQLQQRGLVITDLAKAGQFLNNVSYFRFAAYLRPLESNPIHQFKAGSTFEQAEALYTFDAELRKILFAAIQRIEISLRSRVIHQFSLSHGPFWFYDASLTVSKYKFAENLAALERELKRTKDILKYLGENKRSHSIERLRIFRHFRSRKISRYGRNTTTEQ